MEATHFIQRKREMSNSLVKFVRLEYPREDGWCGEINIGLVDVRAADSIRVSYDFDRDGWVIKQASVFEWDVGDTEMDEDWQEVAFIQALAREGK